MTEPTELLACPFCGAAAHFEMDEERWEWVECESCGMQGNRSTSLMEDCKPKLAEAWNRRTPAPTGAEPVAWLRNTTDPQPHAVTNLKYRSAVDAKAGVEYIPVFAAHQPVEREPLVEARRLFDAGWKAAALFCDREDVVADGIIGFGACPQFEAAFSAAHGIKGGQRGTE